MKSKIVIDVMKEFSNSNIKKMKFKYGRMEIELEKKDKTEDNDILVIKDVKQEDKNEKWILSPIVGKYCKSNLKEGDIVHKGDTLCIIEAMKTFNEIKAEANYKIVKILANENDILECNQKMILVREVYD